MSAMRFGSFISTSESSDAAVDEVLSAARDAGLKPDLLFVFFTGHHCPEADRMIEKLWLELDPQVAAGCSAEGVIGADREIERSPGLAILAGECPQVGIHPFHIAMEDWRGMLQEPERLIERIGYGEMSRAIVAFGDPFTTPVNQLLPLLDEKAPKAPLVGGMASAARQRGQNVLVRNDQTFDEGFVGVTLSGPVEVQTIVSQGCRPIGQPFVITKAHDNVIEQLGGKPALEAVRDTINSISESDQSLLKNGLLLGRAISEYRERFGQGDFLIRNLIGADKETGTISLADFVKVGQTVQFQVRDAKTADEDLDLMLQGQDAASPPAAALLFGCNGRGTNLFAEPNHDVAAVSRSVPGTAIAGFFAAGELGPVGGHNFIHGHTASIALLRAASQ